MDDQQVRDIVADSVDTRHGNKEFIRQIRSGEQDDGPFMVAGFAVRDWVLEQFKAKEEMAYEEG